MSGTPTPGIDRYANNLARHIPQDVLQRLQELKVKIKASGQHSSKRARTNPIRR